jgi:SAM-dependent methyltransferase
MVQVARKRHPGIDLRQADARDLASFDDGSFDLVTFSYNGIDAVDHEDRQLILKSFHRVLRPGGYLMFSTLNADGPAARERPWRRNPPMPWDTGSLQPTAPSRLRRALQGLLMLKHAPDLLAGMRNWLRLRRQERRGDGWTLAPMGAHRFGLLVHFTRPAEIRREMTAHHFAIEQIVGSDHGAPLTAGQDTSPDWWYHVIARSLPMQ